MSDGSNQRELEGMLSAALWRRQGHRPESDRARVAVLRVAGSEDPLAAAIAARVREGVAEAGGQAVELAASSEWAGGESLRGAWKAEARLAAQTIRLMRAWKPDAAVVVAGDEGGLIGALRGLARMDLPALAMPLPGSPWDPAWRRWLVEGVEMERSKRSLEAWSGGLDILTGREGFGGAWAFPSIFRYMLEALGLASPGSTTVLSMPALEEVSRRSGWDVVRMANNKVRFSQVMTQAAIQNGLALHASLGGSPSALWRLLQLAGELSAAVKPAWVCAKGVPDFVGDPPSEREGHLFQSDGGVAGLMLLMLEKKAVDGSGRDASQRRWRDSLSELVLPDALRFFRQPTGQAPPRRDWVLRGNLAPLGLIANASSRGGSVSLPAKVVNGEAAAVGLYRQNRVRGDEILVVRAPGQRLPLLQAARKACEEDHWLLTDGLVDFDTDRDTGLRLPSEGGAWEALKDGDPVSLNLDAGAVDTQAAGTAAREAAMDPWDLAEWDRLKRFGFSRGTARPR